MPYSQFPFLDLDEIRHPRLVLDDFFGAIYHFPQAIRLLHKIIRSAFCHKSRLNKKDVLNALYFKEQFAKLLEAASLLTYIAKAEIPVTIDADTRLPEAASFCPPKTTPADAWDFFPRHLSRREFANPYSVFEKCFHRKHIDDWKELLDILFHAAAYDGFFTLPPKNKDIHHNCHRLFKFIEACHLLYLREPKALRE